MGHQHLNFNDGVFVMHPSEKHFQLLLHISERMSKVRRLAAACGRGFSNCWFIYVLCVCMPAAVVQVLAPNASDVELRFCN